MKSSSAAQLELEYKIEPSSEEGDKPHISSAALSFPHFGASGEVYAATSRIAGRINAASVSEKEIEELLRERQSLLDKKFAGTITRKESNRLEYVRWSLDRVEDAKYGQVLDALENVVSRYEKFESDIRDLYEQLSQLRKRRR